MQWQCEKQHCHEPPPGAGCALSLRPEGIHAARWGSRKRGWGSRELLPLPLKCMAVRAACALPHLWPGTTSTQGPPTGAKVSRLPQLRELHGVCATPMLFAALGGREPEVTPGEGGASTYPPPVPPFLLKCVRGSLEASFSSSVHSRSHSSSVYTSPDWGKGSRFRRWALPSLLTSPARRAPQDPGQAHELVATSGPPTLL